MNVPPRENVSTINRPNTVASARRRIRWNRRASSLSTMHANTATDSSTEMWFGGMPPLASKFDCVPQLMPPARYARSAKPVSVAAPAM